MEMMKRILAALTVMGGFAPAADATILIFDQVRDSATQTMVVPTIAGATAQQDYGDRATGLAVGVPGGQFTYGEAGEGFTPNVSVEYRAAAGVNLWTTQYGDLVNVLFARAPLGGGPDPERLEILLAADPGAEVRLYGFDLGGWADRDFVIDGVSVSDGSAALFSQSDLLVQGDFDGPRRTAIEFATPLTAALLQIEIDFSNLLPGQRDNIGIDNIRFGQTGLPAAIPLPAAIWLFGVALLGLAGLNRQQRGRSESSAGTAKLA